VSRSRQQQSRVRCLLLLQVQGSVVSACSTTCGVWRMGTGWCWQYVAAAAYVDTQTNTHLVQHSLQQLSTGVLIQLQHVAQLWHLQDNVQARGSAADGAPL
jgi:hypothetical protein